jgi:hypothetical protein
MDKRRIKEGIKEEKRILRIGKKRIAGWQGVTAVASRAWKDASTGPSLAVGVCLGHLVH